MVVVPLVPRIKSHGCSMQSLKATWTGDGKPGPYEKYSLTNTNILKIIRGKAQISIIKGKTIATSNNHHLIKFFLELKLKVDHVRLELSLKVPRRLQCVTIILHCNRNFMWREDFSDFSD
uniref:CSON001372 protein n=1 Tax=Culicoides sonorensis TaxID=179676 RepID=A0A336MKU0_CULSO